MGPLPCLQCALRLYLGTAQAFNLLLQFQLLLTRLWLDRIVVPLQGYIHLCLQMLDLLLGLGQVQLSSCECAVQAAPLCIQAQGVLMASKLLPLHLIQRLPEGHTVLVELQG